MTSKAILEIPGLPDWGYVRLGLVDRSPGGSRELEPRGQFLWTGEGGGETDLEEFYHAVQAHLSSPGQRHMEPAFEMGGPFFEAIPVQIALLNGWKVYRPHARHLTSERAVLLESNEPGARVLVKPKEGARSRFREAVITGLAILALIIWMIFETVRSG